MRTGARNGLPVNIKANELHTIPGLIPVKYSGALESVAQCGSFPTLTRRRALGLRAFIFRAPASDETVRSWFGGYQWN